VRGEQKWGAANFLHLSNPYRLQHRSYRIGLERAQTAKTARKYKIVILYNTMLALVKNNISSTPYKKKRHPCDISVFFSVIYG
jgi:hypothetical protein